MATRERELKEIEKYIVAMEYVRDRCLKGENIGYKHLQYEYNLQPIAVKAMTLMGYIERKSHGKYTWKTNKEVSPYMARVLYDWMKKYFLSSKEHQRIMQGQEINVDIEEPIIEEDMAKQDDQCKIYYDIEDEPLIEQKLTANETYIEEVKVVRLFGIKILSITKNTKAYDA